MIGYDYVAVTVGQDIPLSRASKRCVGLRFGTGGSATLKSPNGNSVLFTNIANGETIPGSTVQVVSVTGCSDIVAYFGN